MVPTICEPLIGQLINVCKTQNPHLTGLELADQESRLEVDVLVGSDYYWDLVTGAVSKSTSGSPYKARMGFIWPKI